MEQATYIRYVLAKLSKFVQISTQTSSDFFLQDSLKIKKDLELVSRRYFPCTFLIKFFFCHVTWTSQISSPDWVYFPSYLAKCVSCFMLRHLMTSWHLNIWKIKIWLSQERKELSKWNKKHFSLFHKCSLLDIQNKLAKM